MNYTKLLASFRPCADAVEWYDDRDSEQAWAECDRGDWMLWIAKRLGVDWKLLMLAACDCAEPALKHVSKGEARPRIAIETARRWVNGDATAKAEQESP